MIEHFVNQIFNHNGDKHDFLVHNDNLLDYSFKPTVLGNLRMTSRNVTTLIPAPDSLPISRLQTRNPSLMVVRRSPSS